jgi:hypothetical protein
LGEAKPRKFFSHQQFGHLGVMGILHRHDLCLKSMLNGESQDFGSAIIGKQDTPFHSRE